jgi:hypothetical protein
MGYLAMPYLALTAGATTTGGAIWLAPDNVSGWSMTVVTTGTLTGTFRFYRSDDPRARPDSSAADRAAAVWTEFTADVATSISNPGGGAVQFSVMVSDFRSAFMRMDYTHTSGTGTVMAYFSGHGGC